MSLFRASRYRLAPAVPSLSEIQSGKFYEFLSTGIAQSLHAINPIHFPQKNVRVVLYPDLYQWILPTITERDALTQKKTYAISLYVPGHLFIGDVPLEAPQWLYLGQLPMMTARGHFVVNGLVRVLVHQILRRPGVYFKEKRQGSGAKEKRVLWADFICQRGSWVRVQRDNKKRFWFCLKNTPKIQLDDVISSMAVIENCLAANRRPSPEEEEMLRPLAKRLGFPDKKHVKATFDFLYTRFKNPKVYTLGTTARYQINCKLHLAESSFQLTANDLRQTKAYLIGFDQNQHVPDDIDNLSNRRIRTSSEFFRVRLDAGLALLAKSVKKKIELTKRLTSAKLLFDGKALAQAYREHFLSNSLSQILDQVNPLSEITHKRRIYATGPGGVGQENASLEMRSIHPTYYGRICPIETPEGKRAGLVNSLTVFGRVDHDGFIQTPYYRMCKGQIQIRGGLHYMTTVEEQGKGVTIAPLDLGRDRSQTVSGDVNVPARIATERQEDFVNIPREKVEYIGIAPPQLMSIATSLIPFLEHDDANRALMGSNMQRQTVPVMQPTRPIVSTGLEGLVVGESGQALIADRAGIVSYVSGDIIEVVSPAPAFWAPSATPETTPTATQATYHAETPPSQMQSAFPGFIPTTSWSLSPTAIYEDEEEQDVEVLEGVEGVFDAETADPVASPQASLEAPNEPEGLNESTAWVDAMTTTWWSGAGIVEPDVTLTNELRDLAGVGPVGACSDPGGARSDGAQSGGHSGVTHRRYALQTYERSNQETALTQRPAIQEGTWVQRGDLLADCAASVGGHLALGHNLIVAYLPWEGYNFEDAVVISERLIFDDLYTTVHIEKYDTEARRNLNAVDGIEIMSKDLLPNISKWNRLVLDDDGIIRVGQWVEPGDILVRKIIRVKPEPLSPYHRLLLDILEKKAPTSKDVSLRVPRGVRGRIINTQVLERVKVTPQIRAEYQAIYNKKDGWSIDANGVATRSVGGVRQVRIIPDTLPSKVRIFLAEKRRIQVGDKVAGRHGNKGIVSCILPRQDMPYLPDGRSADMVLNPLGVPSRMNVGQVFECLLGLAGSYLHQEFRITPFDEMFGAEASRSIVFLKLYQARLKTKKKWLFQPNFPGKVRVFDGRTGDCFDQFVTVGCAYMLKLVHLVDEKIHARTTGPYAMVTEQPIRGRSKGGGQRLGEMEVWALEAYGAAYTLQEMLSVKSDDYINRTTLTEMVLDPVWTINSRSIIPEHLSEEEKERAKFAKLPIPLRNIPDETTEQVWAKDFKYKSGLKFGLGLSDGFRVILRELQSLCLDIGVYALTAAVPAKGPTNPNVGEYNRVVKERFIKYKGRESEVPIAKKEVLICEPSVDYYREFSRQQQSQFSLDKTYKFDIKIAEMMRKATEDPAQPPGATPFGTPFGEERQSRQDPSL